MKKFFLMLIVLSFFLTGCVKYEVGMEIKKDKSMNLTLIYAVSESLANGSNNLDSDEAKQNLEEMGFTVNYYGEDDLSGLKAIKSFRNIDKISGDKDNNLDLVKMLEEKQNNIQFFKVKKGFLKNTYKASFVYDLRDLDGENAEDTENTDDASANYYSKLIKINYKVNLPNKSLSNNATRVSDDGKELVWNATYGKINSINYEFSIYNSNIIYIIVGAIVSIIVMSFILFVISKKQKLNKNKDSNIEEIEILEIEEEIEILDI